jgi:FSR family fosmidomycin resistance protein-like MFS transporter
MEAVRRPVIRGATAVAITVAVAHGLNDTYTGFLHPLLPRLMQKLGISIALAAALTTTLSLAASLLQPLMGYIADRWDRRAFVVLGPLCSGVFLSMIGMAPSYAVLVVLLILGGLGSAAFHPPGAALATSAAGGRGSGVRYSLFSFGGSLGYAAGPLIAVAVVSRYGLERLIYAMIPIVLITPVLLLLVPASPGGRATQLPTLRGMASLLRGPLGLVFAISAISTFGQRVFLTMEPIAANAAGAPESAGAVMLSVYLAGQAAGSLLGGWLTDRVDRSRLLAVLTFVSMPAHALAIALPPTSAGAITAAVLAGCTSMALLPPVVVIAQEILHWGTALGSGIVMGAAWATGSLGVIVTGVLGDVVGARSAALVCMPVVLIATALALHPALRAHGRPAALRALPVIEEPR